MHTPPAALLDYIEKVEQLIQFQDRIAPPAAVHEIWQACLGEITTMVETQCCALFLVDPASFEFVLHSVTDAERRQACRRELDRQIDGGMFPSVITRRQAAVLPALASEESASVILLPLTTTRRTLGAVLAYSPVAATAFTRENLKLLTLLARQCALLIENTRLYGDLRRKHDSLERAHQDIRRLSMTDALTGCYNRAYLNERLPQEIRRAQRYGHHLSLVICDIDHFKRINDTHGHLCGDAVLKAVARSIQDYIRQDIDWLVRYGGEEFLIVLPETEIRQAGHQVERLRRVMSSTPIHLEHATVRVTASFGVTGLFPALAHKITPEAIIKVADDCLYQAKNKGRNRVISGPCLLVAAAG